MTNIIVNLQVEGCHNFPQAAQFFPKVNFLEHRHRHIFTIEAKKEVTHDDRDVEFILYKREIIDYLNRMYYSEVSGLLEFGPRSCEMLAKELYNHFELSYCKVMEDGENGAETF